MTYECSLVSNFLYSGSLGVFENTLFIHEVMSQRFRSKKFYDKVAESARERLLENVISSINKDDGSRQFHSMPLVNVLDEPSLCISLC